MPSTCFCHLCLNHCFPSGHKQHLTSPLNYSEIFERKVLFYFQLFLLRYLPVWHILCVHLFLLYFVQFCAFLWIGLIKWDYKTPKWDHERHILPITCHQVWISTEGVWKFTKVTLCSVDKAEFAKGVATTIPLYLATKYTLCHTYTLCHSYRVIYLLLTHYRM